MAESGERPTNHSLPFILCLPWSCLGLALSPRSSERIPAGLSHLFTLCAGFFFFFAEWHLLLTHCVSSLKGQSLTRARY